MTVQEAVRMGWNAPDFLVHAWDYVRSETWPYETKKKWLQDWAIATRAVLPEKILNERALSARIARP